MTAIRTVLCPVDLTPLSERGVDLAVAVCRRAGAHLVLEHNLDPRPPGFLTVTWMWSETHRAREDGKPEEAERRLRALLSELAQRVSCEAKLTRGPIDTSLLYLARELPADLLVVASHGKGSVAHRSLADRLARESLCPMLLIGSEEAAGVERLAAGLEEGRALRALLPVERGARTAPIVGYLEALAASLPLELALVELDPDATDAGWETLPHEVDREAEERLRGLLPPALAEGASFHTVAAAGPEAVLEPAARLAVDLVLLPRHRERHFVRRGAELAPSLLHDGPCPLWIVPDEYAERAVEAGAETASA